MFVKVENTGTISVIVEGDLLDPGCAIGKEVSDATVAALRSFEENGFINLTIPGEEKPAKSAKKAVVEEVKEVPAAVEAPVVEEVAEAEEEDTKSKKAKK